LKHTETQEKNVLPSTEAISAEKTMQNIEGFDKSQLKHAVTEEKNPRKESIKHDNVVGAVGQFDKSALKHQEVEEKNSLPDRDAIEGEKKEQEHRKSIGEFDKAKLKRQNTAERIVLPSKEVIQKEKQEQELLGSITKADRNSLKKVETQERNALSEIVAQEKTMKGIESFAKDGLKHTETAEKCTLPTKEDIQAEKTAK